MHDVLVHYLEVNFPEIAEQLAHARTREPGNEERAAAAERLRELIRRLRRGAVESGAAWHEPRASAARRRNHPSLPWLKRRPNPLPLHPRRNQPRPRRRPRKRRLNRSLSPSWRRP